MIIAHSVQLNPLTSVDHRCGPNEFGYEKLLSVCSEDVNFTATILFVTQCFCC